MDIFGPKITAGMVAIAGPPNAGKSTLLNSLLGQKISIVTHKPQTTRNRIVGIVNDDAYQVVFLDTPGLHESEDIFNVEMVRIAMQSLTEVDLVLFLVDVSQPVEKYDASVEKYKKKREEIESFVKKIEGPAIMVLNKVDLIEREKLLPIIDYYSSLYPFKGVVPVSALKNEGVQILLDEILECLPEGYRYFPEDIPTDATERFLCAEIIREKIFLQTGQEIPYSTAVLIESFKEDEQKNRITIHAAIVLERNSQKGIVIGKGGSKLKSIGIAARKDIENLLDSRVVLKLWVKVKKNWSKDGQFLKELGM